MVNRIGPSDPRITGILIADTPRFRHYHRYVSDFAFPIQRPPVVHPWTRFATVASPPQQRPSGPRGGSRNPCLTSGAPRKVPRHRGGSPPSDRYEDKHPRHSPVGSRQSRRSRSPFPRRNYDREVVTGHPKPGRRPLSAALVTAVERSKDA